MGTGRSCLFCGGAHNTGQCQGAKAIAAPQTPSVETTLTERASRYGKFKHQAEITQALLLDMQCARNWPKLDDDVKEALHMIASKIARIVNGDPTYVDNWHDIAGYALLIEKRLTTKETV